jgi:DNA-binding CsgD family transcriptional regulator
MRVLTKLGISAHDDTFARGTVAIAEEGAARNPGVASFEATALHLRGLVHQDLDLLARAAQTIQESPRPLLRANVYQDNGRLLITHGDRTAGIAHLEQARDQYRQLDVVVEMRSTQRVLRQAGVRTRNRTDGPAARPLSGWDSLTDTELKVARLISAGHTNRSAAKQLNVSTNTIGTHLRSIFAKLQLQSRVQLANARHAHRVE